MHIADRDIALLPQRVIGQIEFLQVVVNVLVAPVDDRQKLEQAVLQPQHLELAAGVGLTAAQAGKPGPRLQVTQGTLHRLHLVELVVAADTLYSLLPQLAVTGLLPGRRAGGLIDLEVEPQPLGQLVDETIGFRKQIAGIGKNHRYVGLLLGHQMEHDRRLNTEAGGEHRLSVQILQRPAYPLGGRHGRQLPVQRSQSLLLFRPR